jgi:hypothetical protein
MAAGDANLIVGLSELAAQVRQGTLQLLDATDTACLTWSPPGTSNHILWHAGHALWVNDALTIEPLTGRSELPRGWPAKFGQDSQPATIREWPDVDEVASLLATQLERILKLHSEYSETIVQHANQRAAGGWPLLAGMIHGWHDEARHQGEMYLLYKLCHART